MKKLSLLLIVSLSAVAFQVNAQSSLKLKVANMEFDRMRYADAIVHFEEILTKDQNNAEVRIKLGECYRKVRDSKNALRIYAQLANEEKSNPKYFWYYAQALAENGYYLEAASWYEKYSNAVVDGHYARAYATAYKNIETFFEDSSDYLLQELPFINSPQSDFSPVYHGNGFLFISNRKQQNVVRTTFEQDQSSFLDFYFAADTTEIESLLNNPIYEYKSKKHYYNGEYTIATSNDNSIPAQYGDLYKYDTIHYYFEDKNLVKRMVDEGVKTRYHEGPLTYTASHDTVYFTRSTSFEKGKSDKRTSRLAIFISYIKDGKWIEAREISLNGRDFSTGHPTMSPDNKRMYFSSDRPGGKGGVDIYYVEYSHGAFSDPVNVEEINTPDDEVFPYVAPDGDLYFSSNGHPGLGGLDLFVVTIDGSKVGEVRNMGSPFNSTLDDFGIAWHHTMTKGFLSSNRKRGLGDDDIYSFKKLCSSVIAYVYDSISGQPLESVLVSTGEYTGYTDKKGRIEFCLKPGDHAFSIAKEHYQEKDSVVSSRSYIEIGLNPLAFDLAGRIVSKENNSPIVGARVVLTNTDTHAITEFETDKLGNYHFPLDISSNYTISVSKKLCGATLLNRTTKGLTQSETLRGDMEMLCKGDIIKVENIYYDLNKWAIRADAATELNKLVDVMNQYPDMRIELRSHTDSRSSAAFNMKLSTKRAESVLDYMAEQGVVPSRMRAAGFGESKPLNRCIDGVKCSEEEFQANRRTEFRILSINDEERSAQDAAWAQQIAENQILRAALADTVKKDEPVPAVALKRPGKAHKKTAAVKPVSDKPAYTIESYAVKEEGVAEVYDNAKSNRKFLALHKTAPSGTMIKIRNETNNREIFVRVVGKLAESEENADTLVKISKSAYDKLEANDSRFKVEVTYFK